MHWKTLQSFEEHWSALKEKAKKDDPDLPKLTKNKNIVKCIKFFKIYLYAIISMRNCPLIYDIQATQRFLFEKICAWRRASTSVHVKFPKGWSQDLDAGADSSKAGAVFPTKSGQESLIVFLFILPIGWKNSPPTLFTPTKIIADLVNQQWVLVQTLLLLHSLDKDAKLVVSETPLQLILSPPLVSANHTRPSSTQGIITLAPHRNVSRDEGTSERYNSPCLPRKQHIKSDHGTFCAPMQTASTQIAEVPIAEEPPVLEAHTPSALNTTNASYLSLTSTGKPLSCVDISVDGFGGLAKECFNSYQI